MKVCSKCGERKDLQDYSRDAKKLDGCFNACKECEKKRRAIWTEANKETIKEQRRQRRQDKKVEISIYNRRKYYENHKENLERARKYHRENKVLVSFKKHLYRIEHIDQEKARDRRWAKENPEKCCQRGMKRYALKKGAAVGVVDYTEILARDGYVCHICKKETIPGEIHFDHIFPLSRGGEHSMDNIAVSHASCNLRKNNKTLEEYYATL